MGLFNCSKRGREFGSPQTAEELLKERTVLIEGMIDDEQAITVIAKMLFLQGQDAHRPITLRIDSPGGRVTAGMAIMETVKDLSPPVNTECREQAHGMAAIILARGSKGQRLVGKGAKLSLVPIQPSEPQTADVDVKLDRTRLRVAQVLAELSGQPEEVVARDLMTGRSFTPQDAVAFGIADRVCD